MAFVGFKGLWEIVDAQDRLARGFATDSPLGSPSGVPRLAVSRNEGGLFRGRTYLSVRGEILRPLKDELQRRHSPRIPSSIKNQSVEIEDD